MTSYRFEEVKIKGTKHWMEDGKRKQETRTFMQTINPFNKAADGTVKCREQILIELMEERRQWYLA